MPDGSAFSKPSRCVPAQHAPDTIASIDANNAAKKRTKRFRVEQIRKGGKDNQDRRVAFIYAKHPRTYAIYWADGFDKVCVHYADSPALEAEQRKRVLEARRQGACGHQCVALRPEQARRLRS
jgi:hypothetical protein